MNELKKVRDWAQAKLDARQEPPWAVERYKNLIGLIDEILVAQAATISLEDSLRLQEQQDSGPQLSGNIVHIDTARHRQSVLAATLPM